MLGNWLFDRTTISSQDGYARNNDPPMLCNASCELPSQYGLVKEELFHYEPLWHGNHGPWCKKEKREPHPSNPYHRVPESRKVYRRKQRGWWWREQGQTNYKNLKNGPFILSNSLIHMFFVLNVTTYCFNILVNWCFRRLLISVNVCLLFPRFWTPFGQCSRLWGFGYFNSTVKSLIIQEVGWPSTKTVSAVFYF